MLPHDVPRQPRKATLNSTFTERRVKRFTPPPCSSCGHDGTRVTLRTAYVLYLRCDRCAAVWNVPAPGADPQFGT
jgi:hypothetical protein